MELTWWTARTPHLPVALTRGLIKMGRAQALIHPCNTLLLLLLLLIQYALPHRSSPPPSCLAEKTLTILLSILYTPSPPSNGDPFSSTSLSTLGTEEAPISSIRPQIY